MRIPTALISKVLSYACAIGMVFPLIDGIKVHGNILQILALGMLFPLAGMAVTLVLGNLLGLIFAVSRRLGLHQLVGHLLLRYMMATGFVLIPALSLMGLSAILPKFLSIAGPGPALAGAMVLCYITAVIPNDRPAQQETPAQEEPPPDKPDQK